METPTEPETADDPRTELVSTLRANLTDLHTQISQLNTKLVSSYNRISDLEDELQVTSDNLVSSKTHLHQLELRVGTHEELLVSGSLVSRDEITAELSKVMERATEEASQRGMAEEAKANIEREIEGLSESLFVEAGRMVSVARRETAVAEGRMREMEKEVQGTEEVVRELQRQLKECASADLPATMPVVAPTRFEGWRWEDQLRRDVVPFTQLTSFVAHIRTLRRTAASSTSASSSSTGPPALSSLLSQPFLTRLVTEDSDPTLRLDAAPGLTWLTRRTVLSAVYAGQLDISPLSSGSIYVSSCALCGNVIHPTRNTDEETKYIFKLPSENGSYSLCTTSYCLTRLRTTISLWLFVRSNLIDYIWTSTPVPVLSPPPSHTSPPPVPPRRRSIMQNISIGNAKGVSMSGLWGALKSGSGRAGSDGSGTPSPTRRMPPMPEIPLSPPPPAQTLSPALPSRPPRRAVSPAPGLGPKGLELVGTGEERVDDEDNKKEETQSAPAPNGDAQTPVPYPEVRVVPETPTTPIGGDDDKEKREETPQHALSPSTPSPPPEEQKDHNHPNGVVTDADPSAPVAVPPAPQQEESSTSPLESQAKENEKDPQSTPSPPPRASTPSHAPPVPRRAARRAPPGPRPITPTRTPSPTPTPAPAPVAENETDAVVMNGEEEKEMQNAIEKPDDDAEVEKEKEVDPDMSKSDYNDSSSPEPDKEVFTDANEVPPVEEKKEEEYDIHGNPQSAPDPPKVTVMVNGHGNGDGETTKSPTTLSPTPALPPRSMSRSPAPHAPPPPPRRNLPPRGGDALERESPVPAAIIGSGKDIVKTNDQINGTPVGEEETWEEKTYREITRLRVEMFWARVGVRRDGTS